MMSMFLQELLPGGLHFTTDGFRLIYAGIAVWMWLLTTVFSVSYFKKEPDHLKRYGAFTLLTFLATEGLFFSADLMTTFFFFEILSLTSFVWVIHEETAPAIRAAKTYFCIAIVGGLLLFMGMALLYAQTGTLFYADLYKAIHKAIRSANHSSAIFAAGICILLGFGAKAGMFPLHIWLPKSHPVAPSPASALLSGILTKVGIFGILMTTVPGFFGEGLFGLIILLAGTITMALGAVLALFSVNLKRTLACSSMSQIGFILVGIGTLVLLSAPQEAGALFSEEANHLVEEGMELAHSGLLLHMINHSLIKLTLFMAAGVFVMQWGKLHLDDLRGAGRNKPFLLIPFLLGALSISGVPFVGGGYISKTLLHEGLVVAREAFVASTLPASLLPLSASALTGLLHLIEWIFLCSGGLTFAYMLKLFLCIFVEKHPEQQTTYDRARPVPDHRSSVVLLLSALVLPLLGIPALAGRLSLPLSGADTFTHFHAFSWTNLQGACISLGIGLLVYFLFVRRFLMQRDKSGTGFRYLSRWPEKWDLEDLLTRRLAALLFRFGQGIATLLSVSTDGLLILIRHTAMKERVSTTETRRLTRWHAFRKKTEKAFAPITVNFSFALMMTCVGIILILGVILLVHLLRG